MFGRIVLAAGSEYKEPAARLWPGRSAFLDRAAAKEKENVCVHGCAGVRVCGWVCVCARKRKRDGRTHIYTHTHSGA